MLRSSLRPTADNVLGDIFFLESVYFLREIKKRLPRFAHSFAQGTTRLIVMAHIEQTYGHCRSLLKSTKVDTETLLAVGSGSLR